MRVFIFVFLVTASLQVVNGHVRWVCPRPQSTDTGIKSGPCGDVNFEGGYLDVVPGPMTVRWEESIYHRGAPSSIRLMKKGDDDTACMLLDHIPHNDAMKVKFPFTDPNCKITSGPIGKCPGVTQVTVNIPDIDCPDCYLLLISVMTDKYGATTACSQLTNGNNNCSTYYTCANIKIRPTAAGVGRGIDTCTTYTDNLLGTWPYMLPNEVYYDESLNYSPDGWLTGGAFIGETATYPAGVQNAGPCAASSRTFGASLSSTSSRAVVSMTVTENRMTLRGIVVGAILGNLTAITLNGQQNGASTMNIPVSMVKGGVIQGTVDISQAAQFINSGKFFTSVAMTFTNETLQGDIVDGVIQSTMSSAEGIIGEAIFIPGASNIGYEIALMGPTSQPNASLFGPARQGMTTNSSIELAIDGSRIGPHGWYGKGTLIPKEPVSMSVMLLYMWKEMMYLEVSSGSTWKARGHLSAPSKEVCASGKSVLCQYSEITINGQQPDKLKKELDTHGLATFHYDVTEKALKMSAFLLNAKPNENMTGLQLTSGSSQLYSAMGDAFIPSTLQDNTFILRDRTIGVGLDDNKRSALQRGEMKIKVLTSRYPSGIYGNIQPLSQLPLEVATTTRSTSDDPSNRGCQMKIGAAFITVILVLTRCI